MIRFRTSVFLISLLVLVLGSSRICQAFTFTGPTVVGLNSIYTYSYTNGTIIQAPSWSGARATVQSTWSVGTTYYASIKWTSTGTGNVNIFDQDDNLIYQTSVTISTCTTITTPNTTGASRFCTGSVTLTALDPGTDYGVRWYDNTSTSPILGTGTSYATVSLNTTVNYNATRYQVTTGCESAKVSVTATINAPSVASSGSTNTCSGATTALTLTNPNSMSGVTYTWSSTSTNVSGASSGTANPIAQTLTATTAASGTATYTISAMSGGCLGPSIQVVVTVKPKPTVAATGNNQVICSGQNTAITLSNPNGVSGTTYSWTIAQSNTSGAATGTNTSSTSIAQALSSVTGNTAGTTTYTITATASSCTSTSTAVLVNVNPVPTLGVVNNSANVCSGQQATSITLSNPNTVSGTVYSWTVTPTNVTGATAVSNTSSTSIAQSLTSTTGTTSGSIVYGISASATFSSLTCSSSSTANVTVNPVPVASTSNQSVFSTAATSIGISSTVTGTTYSWVATPTNASGASNGSGSTIAQTLTATTSANGSVVYAITPTATGCAGSVVNATATVVPCTTVTASSNTVLVGSPVNMDGGSGYATWNWKEAADPVTTLATTQTYSTYKEGNYQVTVTKTGITGNCGSPTFNVQPQLGGQSYNYIVSNTLLSATTDNTRVKMLPIDSVSQTVQYFDGLGRPMQSVITQGSPAKLDIIVPNVYDTYGREYRKYLPVTGETTGWYKPGLLSTANNYAGAWVNYYNNTTDKIADDSRYFSETQFETSPLNRPTQDLGAGVDWYTQSKAVQHAYLVNAHGTSTGQEQIYAWVVDSYSGLPVVAPDAAGVIAGGYYASGQLSIKSTIDEQGHEVREYTDKGGHLILKKVQLIESATLSNPDHWTHTYYIYDVYGRLVMVLSPEAFNTITK